MSLEWRGVMLNLFVRSKSNHFVSALKRLPRWKRCFELMCPVWMMLHRWQRERDAFPFSKWEYLSRRFLCSSRLTTLRAWSSVRIATYTIIISTIIIGLFYTYVPILYDIKPGRSRCPTNQGPYPSFNGIWNLIVFSTGPPVVMLIFGSLTIRHLRETVKRIEPQKQLISINPAAVRPRRHKTTDRQLIRMMIFQCAFFSMTSSLISISWIYTAVKPTVVSDAFQAARDDLFVQVVGAISITGSTTSFYVFVLSSRLFRDELMHLFHRCGLQHPRSNA